jgi:hypothetical protein
LIGIHLYTFENGPLDIKILVANIKSTILKKQKGQKKSRRGGSSVFNKCSSMTPECILQRLINMYKMKCFKGASTHIVKKKSDSNILH